MEQCLQQAQAISSGRLLIYFRKETFCASDHSLIGVASSNLCKPAGPVLHTRLIAVHKAASSHLYQELSLERCVTLRGGELAC